MIGKIILCAAVVVAMTVSFYMLLVMIGGEVIK